MTILIVADQHNGKLQESTLHTITAARRIGSEISVLVAGHGCHNLAQEVAKIAGIEKVLLADNEIYANNLAENLAPLVVRLSTGKSHVMASSSTNGKNFMPRAAALADRQMISEISAVISADTFERPVYAGNAVERVRLPEEPRFITVRSTAFEAAEPEGGLAKIEILDDGNDSGLSTFIKQELNQTERPDLASARIVISGGRGMQDKSNFAMLEKLADKLGAALGASRAAVDAGYMPNDSQIGQTGKVVAPDLYIAVGISGAIQHLAGMKDSRVIVAINKDADAPIFQVADYGLVADLFEAIPALEAVL